MKRILILMLAGLLLLSATALAAPDKIIGDAKSVDTGYPAPFIVNLVEWFATHPIEQGKKLRMEPIFQTPRMVVMAAANKGQTIDPHYHTSSDEIVFAYQGECEQFVDGKWVTMKAGDIHFNPRGVIHATRVTTAEPFLAVSVFLAPPAGGNDRIFLDGGKTQAKAGDIVGDWTMLDTQYKKGAIINLDGWYDTHPVEPGKMRSEPAMGTMRGQLMIAQKPALGVHYHGSADELIYTYKGDGELWINGEWVKVKAGDMHFCPRGTIHGIRPAGDIYKIFAIFTPPQANGSDRIFVDFK